MADLVSVKVETRLLPPIDIGYDPLTEGEGGAPAGGSSRGWFGTWLMRLLRPKVTVSSPLGVNIQRAPWGDPGPSTWPLILLLPGGLLLVTLLAWRKWRRRRHS